MGEHRTDNPARELSVLVLKGKVTSQFALLKYKQACRTQEVLLVGERHTHVYKTRLTSPTELECTWQGRYELAASTKAA